MIHVETVNARADTTPGQRPISTSKALPALQDDDCSFAGVAGVTSSSLVFEVEDSDHEHPTDSDPTATGACASDDVFFRVAHTSVGSHKMVLKGSVATTDIGVQILKVTHITPEEVSLSIDAQGMPQAVLAKWITDPQVTYQSLADNLKQWTMVKNKLFAIDMQKLRTMLPDLPQAGVGLSECKDVVAACLASRAYGGSKHAFFRSEAELACSRFLCHRSLLQEVCSNQYVLSRQAMGLLAKQMAFHVERPFLFFFTAGIRCR